MLQSLLPFVHRRLLLAMLLVGTLPGHAQSAEADRAWQVLREGGIVLFRHANAPGTGDPAGFRLDDCATQRNLDERGREQARRIGGSFRSRTLLVGEVLTSQWCRARETAELAFPGMAKPEPTFNSFFDDRSTETAQTAAARAILAGWSGPGALVVTTHQVNITALTGIVPASGEGVVLSRRDGRLAVAGRIRPD
jgi:phosphohistidine phosphatase SixA